MTKSAKKKAAPKKKAAQPKRKTPAAVATSTGAIGEPRRRAGAARAADAAAKAAPSENGVVRMVTFIQYDEPALKVDSYTLTVSQTTNTEAPNSFSTSRQFAVSGERFSFDSGQVDSVYPPDLANGEFYGAVASVVLNARTLPWERYLDTEDPELPWLAVLLFNVDEQPVTRPGTAADLVPLGEKITVLGSDVTGTGLLPTDTLSYPHMNPLGYGETPDEACTVIDIDLDVFNRIAPSKSDMSYLAHIRKVDTIDTVKNVSEETIFSVVLGNRIAQADKPAYAFFVSLERMAAYLPDDDGKPAKFPDDIKKVRLISYRSWRFAANTMDQSFRQLLENLNGPVVDKKQYTTVMFPATLDPPDHDAVEAALALEAQGDLDAPGAEVLAVNAFWQGYVPMNEQMRHANTTVSWYRGPCLPYAAADERFVSASSADAINRYNPLTGLFDISYGAAWQLGQLMALQNKLYANALFNWKKAVNAQTAAKAEQEILDRRLTTGLSAGSVAPFAALLAARAEALNDPPPLPDIVSSWLSKLRLLHGVPYAYLVPNEQMVPLESLRFFYLDENWTNHLVDGAFSIGRTTRKQLGVDTQLMTGVRAATPATRFQLRRQRPMQFFRANAEQRYTGFLLRSQVVRGWPNLQVNGYAVPDNIHSEIKKLRMDRLSPDCIICIFDGEVNQVAIHEPPEQLHCGIALDLDGIQFSTTLRAVTDKDPAFEPGQQFLTDPKGGPPLAVIPMRPDGQTILATRAVASVVKKLNDDFDQGITVFTSAEFALEMIKGVWKVNFNRRNGVGP